ncbi:MAG: hypothetical protein AAGD35_08585 [Actinomycetota bacterium]
MFVHTSMPAHIAAPRLHPTEPAPVRPPRPPLFNGTLSFSRFASFVLAQGAAKEIEVSTIRAEQGLYSGALDYWALFRNQVAIHHQYPAARPGAGALEATIDLAPADRQWHYARAVAEYRRFLMGRTVSWLAEPRQALWLAKGLRLRVNPELHLLIDGAPVVVKLYLRAPRAQALTAEVGEALAHVLDTTHGHLGFPMVFDVLRGAVFGPPRSAAEARKRLQGEAFAFVDIWSSLDNSANTEPLPAVP